MIFKLTPHTKVERWAGYNMDKEIGIQHFKRTALMSSIGWKYKHTVFIKLYWVHVTLAWNTN